MEAIILAAGVGSRLRPLTDNTPKCLLTVGGIPILERQIKALAANGIRKIAITTGYLASEIERFVQQPQFSNLKIRLSPNPDFETTNNAYSLSLALQSVEGEFMLLDGDLVFNPGLLRGLIRSDSPSSMSVDTDLSRLTDEAMKAKADSKNRITHLSKQMDWDLAAGEYIGLAYFSKEITQKLKTWMFQMNSAERANGYYEDGLNAIIAQCAPIQAVPTNGLEWMEVDTVEDLEEANRAFLAP